MTQLRGLLAQNADLNERVRRAAARTTALNERFLRRFSAELHDGPARSWRWRCCGSTTSSRACPAMTPTWTFVQHSLQRALAEVRATSTGLLLPQLSDLSLAETLAHAVREHERRTGSRVATALGALPEQAPLPVKIAAYRLTQEALTNAWRHAHGAGQRLQASADADELAADHQRHGARACAPRRPTLASIWACWACVSASRAWAATSRSRARRGVARASTRACRSAPPRNTRQGVSMNNGAGVNSLNVAVVDDHPLFREGVAHTLGAQPDIEVVGRGRVGRRRCPHRGSMLPDVLLLDVSMPGGGITLCVQSPRVSGREDRHADRFRGRGRRHRGAASGRASLCAEGRRGPGVGRILRDVAAGEVYVTPPGRQSALRDDGGGRQPAPAVRWTS